MLRFLIPVLLVAITLSACASPAQEEQVSEQESPRVVTVYSSPT
jgi:hypothetical protein